MKPTSLARVSTIALLLLSSFAASGKSEYLFRNGQLVTMVSPEPIRADLLVRDGHITTIGPDLSASPEAIVIDMKGGYLMPGLAEMHAHVPAPSQGQQYRDDVLFLWIAHGVTTVRGMLGLSDKLSWTIGWRDQGSSPRGLPSTVIRFRAQRRRLRWFRRNKPPVTIF